MNVTATTVGTWNVEHGHPVKEHATTILRRQVEERVRVLALTELGDYAAALDGADPRRVLLWVPGPENVKSQGLLVPVGAQVGQVRSIPTPATYRAPDGSLRRSACPLLAEVDGVLYVVVHAPVGAWTTGRWPGRRFVGPIRRRLAYRAYVRRLLRVFRAHPHTPLVVIGDWNATPDTRGRWSPEWLRRKAGAAYLRPHASTGHGEIDFALVRGVRGTLTVRHTHPEPSDHLLVAGPIRKKANP